MSQLSQNRRPGRPRKAPITLATLEPRNGLQGALMSPKMRVDHAKLSMALNADPLGIRSGEYGRRPKWMIGDATGERMQHARQAGQRIVLEAETTEAGAETDLRRKRLVSRLEQLRSRTVIQQDRAAALARFQGHVALAASLAGRRGVAYEPRMVDATVTPELAPAEQALKHAKAVAQHYLAVPKEFIGVLNWLRQDATDGEDFGPTAAEYWPNLGKDARNQRFFSLVEVVGVLLAGHFGLDQHKWRGCRPDVSRRVSAMIENIKNSILPDVA